MGALTQRNAPPSKEIPLPISYAWARLLPAMRIMVSGVGIITIRGSFEADCLYLQYLAEF